MKNKRGTATRELIIFVVIAMIMIVVVGLYAYLFNAVTGYLGADLNAGQVNMANVTASTMGQINTAILDKLDLLGMMILFGMTLGMFINAYFTRNDYPKLFIVLDIIILIVAFIVSVYISNMYETIITTEPFTSFFVTYLNKPSTFLLNLPIISVVVGIILIVLSYSNIPRSFTEEQYRAGGDY